MRFHGRSRDAVLERYGGAKVRHDAPMPAGVEAMPVARFDETMYWLPGPRALVPGDRLIGDGERRGAAVPGVVAGLHPPTVDVDALRVALAPLLELPVEHVLVSHGAPVVGGGGAALARALAALNG